MEDRSGNKMWLVRHLEVTRQIMLEDMKVAKVGTYTVKHIYNEQGSIK